MNHQGAQALSFLHEFYNIDQLLFGEDLVRELIRTLANTLNVKYVMVGHALEPERAQIQSDFLWAGGEFADNVLYDLSGTPCAHVICGTRVNCFAEKVIESFPGDKMLQDLSVESYIGAPFLQTDGGLLGLLVVMNDQRIDDKDLYSAIVEFFAARIGTEYRRSAVEKSLRLHNESLEKGIRERTQELQVAFKKLQRAQRKLISQEKLATVGRVTLGIAHELKNPLNVIINSAEIISDSLNEELDTGLISKTAGMIYAQGIRANNIITDILKQARQDSSDTTQSVDLSALLSEALDTCVRSINDDRFKDVLTVDTSIPTSSVTSIFDANSVERAFINIIDNALYALNKKYSSTGNNNGYSPQISIQLKFEEDFYIIRISDNGSGIPTHQQAKVFDEFYTTKPAGEGTGLGLAIARQIIEKNSGDIQLNSSEGQGTTVIIDLPHLEIPTKATL
ncbi:MAG: ATP-binding protein [Bdellovibrio sp.]